MVFQVLPGYDGQPDGGGPRVWGEFGMPFTILIRAIVRRGALLAALLSLLLACGCGLGVAGAVLGLVYGNKGEDSGAGVGLGPVFPRIKGFSVLCDPPHAPRATVLSQVKLSFALVEGTSGAADVEVTFRDAGPSGGAWKSATIAEGLSGLATSPEGTVHTLTWDAVADGLSGCRDVEVRIRAFDEDGEESAIAAVTIGNEPPRVVLTAPEEGAMLSEMVAVKFILDDSSRDPSSIVLKVSTDGGRTYGEVPRDHVVLGKTTNLLPDPAEEQGLGWDSRATLGPVNASDVYLAIEADDGLPGGCGSMACCGPLSLFNGAPPAIVLDPPPEDPGAHGAIALPFRLKYASSDVIFQWSTDPVVFPDITDLVMDSKRRRQVLLDPDEWPSRHIITPRLRTIVEGSCRLLGDEADDEVMLAELTPPVPLTPARFRGATFELLTDRGAVEQRRLIVDVLTRSSKVTLDRPLDPSPRRGQRFRVRESFEKVFLDIPASAIGFTRYTVAWDVRADIGPEDGETSYWMRGTAVAGIKPSVPFLSSLEASPVAALSPYDPPLRRATGDSPWSVVSADLDGDGLLDLVSADSSANQLSIFFGEGQRDFSPVEELETGTTPRSVAAADVDGDGHLDLAAAVLGARTLRVFFGQGGRASPSQPICQVCSARLRSSRRTSMGTRTRTSSPRMGPGSPSSSAPGIGRSRGRNRRP